MPEKPYSKYFDDIYFDQENGLEESRYVFLKQNYLPQSWQDKSQFVICETGFGTGLNFLCTWTEFEKTTKPTQQLHYYSVEKFPLTPTEIEKYLSHWSGEFHGRLEILLREYPLRIGGWHTIRVSSQVTLTLIFDDVNRALPELYTPIDCWFLDGHAPAKNPDMWSDIVFENIARLSYNGTRCATFTAAGLVKQSLTKAGFTVIKATGYGHKQDMTVGLYEHKVKSTPTRNSPKHVAIIGGGIAGATLATALHQRAGNITIFEKTGIASGGSGNAIGLYNPRIASNKGHEADFYSSAFSLAHRVFNKMIDIDFKACGNLHAITDAQKDKRFHGFINNWGWNKDHVVILNPQESSDMAGVKLTHSNLYFPDAGMVSPKKITKFLARPAEIILSDIINLEQDGKNWRVNNQLFDTVILAGGFESIRFPMTHHLPLQKIRGQITQVKPTKAYQNLRTNLSYGGYSSIAVGGEAIIGSTFQHWIDDDALRDEDDEDNINKLKLIAPELAEGLVVTGGRASFRCAAKDRTPVIGKMDGFDNLYISTAHGSHGILSSFMGAELLTAKIYDEPHILPISVETALSPNRFKNVIKPQ